MKKTYFPQTITFLFLFFFIAISYLSAEEKQKLAGVVNNKASGSIENIVVTCARENDDMNKCLSCHVKNGWMDMKYIHGPIAMNECRPCHIKPDKQEIQKVGSDNLCDFCHQHDEIKNAHPEINTDGSSPASACITCHNPHASNKEYFLK